MVQQVFVYGPLPQTRALPRPTWFTDAMKCTGLPYDCAAATANRILAGLTPVPKGVRKFVPSTRKSVWGLAASCCSMVAPYTALSTVKASGSWWKQRRPAAWGRTAGVRQAMRVRVRGLGVGEEGKAPRLAVSVLTLVLARPCMPAP